MTTNVQIPNVANKPILSNGAFGACKNLLISNLSSLTVIGNTIKIAGTITNNGTFTATAGTIEMKGANAQIIGSNVFAGNRIMNLIINNTFPAGVTLQGSLDVTGTVMANGNLASGGYLTLISTAAQTALIDGTGTGNITGNVTMQRYLPLAFGYKYFSSPFQAATVSEFSDDMDLGAIFPTFYNYNENHYSPSGVVMSGWTVYTDPSGVLNPMEGYASNFGTSWSEKTVDITGVVNNGSYQATLMNHNSKYTKGFNLVGNPYPSPINWDAPGGWIKSNIDDAVYFFNSGNTDQYTGFYTSYAGGVSTGSGANDIAAMQGFFVHVSDGAYPTSGTLAVTNLARTNNLSPSFKDAKLDNRVILRFSASFEIKNAIEDVAVIYFDDNAKKGFDKDLDALKMTNTDVLVPNLYTITTESRQLSINGMPPPSDGTTIVPLGFTTFSDGWIDFIAKDINLLPSKLHLYLVDAKEGITQDLNINPKYRFYLNKGESNQRFTLVFSFSVIEEPTDFTEKMFSIVQSAELLTVKVNLPYNTKGSLMVTNMLGQAILIREVFEIETVEINSTVTGVYVVTMVSGKRKQSEKILIRKYYE